MKIGLVWRRFSDHKIQIVSYGNTIICVCVSVVKRHGGAQGNVMANVDGRVNGHFMTNDLSQD